MQRGERTLDIYSIIEVVNWWCSMDIASESKLYSSHDESWSHIKRISKGAGMYIDWYAQRVLDVTKNQFPGGEELI